MSPTPESPKEQEKGRTRRESTRGTVYEYTHNRPSHTASYLWPVLLNAIARHSFTERRAFDLGCGNGATAGMLAQNAFFITGIDPSETGIAIAKKNYPALDFHVASADDDLAGKFGKFPLVVSFEVVSFVLDPRLFARRIFDLVQPSGLAVVSAPYHGFWKNLTISLTNGWDIHLNPLISGTLTRFFSEMTFRRLWAEAGFYDISIVRAGRIPPLAKAMIAILRKQ